MQWPAVCIGHGQVGISLSVPLQTFLQQYLSSFEQIEIVLLLRADPKRAWTAPEVASALVTPPESAAMRLFLLASSGLIAFEPTGVPRYRYLPVDEATEDLLRELADSYPANRAEIATLLSSKPPNDPVRSFADAFRLKK